MCKILLNTTYFQTHISHAFDVLPIQKKLWGEIVVYIFTEYVCVYMLYVSIYVCIYM